MNHIKIHISFEKHDSIIEFVGFYYTDRTFGILLQNAEYDLLHAIKMDKYENDEIFFEFFIKRIVEIINGMVCSLQIVNRFIYRYVICLQIYLIENEIIHRNLKACNVLIDKHGRAKVFVIFRFKNNQTYLYQWFY